MKYKYKQTYETKFRKYEWKYNFMTWYHMIED